ncbi:mononuclear molybdenum enzyme YedY [Thioclava sp. SK-1]|uniref:protein-methionine-sulfoxide reductase catalytic subunit MsrP n=1 Tax=Thioclava sp. SK-1 TaxID=1889770 RepID=UPI000826A9D9|nr:protein-methionine-sulfoxide reductase catalytic subunit MsrP [Thioclava sp. SK-1]OCX60410.1 mononuclear molybdenum enzyme YedY [Thioclava sp. SK-1]
MPPKTRQPNAPLIRSRKPDALGWADVTPKAQFLNRRQLMAAGAAGLGAIAAPGLLKAASPYSTDAEANTLKEITSYNNFYEFGWDKGDPAAIADQLTTDPWSIEIAGMVDKPGTYDIADITKTAPIEERIYRFRCVEAWSMVIPWNGFQLSALLDRVGVQSGAKYVAFQTLLRPDEMPGQRAGGIDWPYVEGLRLDEAMNPLTLLATGIYGEPMPNQNGAPIRLVVPWKYGFKSIKSIVKITLTDTQPPTTWNILQPREYGFYANVNPTVDHPRWSQATERRIGGGLFGARQETFMFNGYGDEVADMYAGMDLAKNY